MTDTAYTEYFLGANGPEGFRSYFTDACPVGDGWNICVIKGGPGTGKSSLMKKLCAQAQAVGLEHERIYCSSDPDSLDGVIIPMLHAAVFDGTAPHVIEPKYPGAYENIIDLGQAWSTAKLRSVRGDIIALSSQCSEHHAQAARFLRCADAFRRSTALPAEDCTDRGRIGRAAAHLADKYAGKGGAGGGRERRRLISAVTPDGIRTFERTLSSVCSVIVPIRDGRFAPSALLMEALRDILITRGHDVIVCACSQSPRTEHILLPALHTAFTVCSDVHAVGCATERAVHTERFMPAEYVSSSRRITAFNRRNVAYFTGLAAAEMRHAKSVHDELEQCYRTAMDFDAVDEIAEKACRTILG